MANRLEPLNRPAVNFILIFAVAAITSWALGAFPVLVAALGVAVILIGRRQRNKVLRKFYIAVGLAFILAAFALGSGLDFGVWEFERIKPSPHYLGLPRP